MASVWANSLLLARGQIAEISGVPAGTLAFWLKNDLLVSVEGGEGRGSHKKFKPIQASFAAILSQLQMFGINIAALKSFSDVLQRGATLADSTHLHPRSLVDAAGLKSSIMRFELGDDVSAHYLQMEEQKDGNTAEDARQSLIPDYTVRYAVSIDEIEKNFAAGKPENDPAEDIIEFSRLLVKDDLVSLEAYAEVKMEMDGLDWSDPSWLIWQTTEGKWEISSQTGPGEQFSKHPNSDAAIFIAIGSIIRRIWGLDLREIRMERLRRSIPSYRKTHPDLAERMTSQLRALETRQADD